MATLTSRLGSFRPDHVLGDIPDYDGFGDFPDTDRAKLITGFTQDETLANGTDITVFGTLYEKDRLSDEIRRKCLIRRIDDGCIFALDQNTFESLRSDSVRSIVAEHWRYSEEEFATEVIETIAPQSGRQKKQMHQIIAGVITVTLRATVQRDNW